MNLLHKKTKKTFAALNYFVFIIIIIFAIINNFWVIMTEHHIYFLTFKTCVFNVGVSMYACVRVCLCVRVWVERARVHVC